MSSLVFEALEQEQLGGTGGEEQEACDLNTAEPDDDESENDESEDD